MGSALRWFPHSEREPPDGRPRRVRRESVRRRPDPAEGLQPVATWAPSEKSLQLSASTHWRGGLPGIRVDIVGGGQPAPAMFTGVALGWRRQGCRRSPTSRPAGFGAACRIPQKCRNLWPSGRPAGNLGLTPTVDQRQGPSQPKCPLSQAPHKSADARHAHRRDPPPDVASERQCSPTSRPAAWGKGRAVGESGGP